MRPSVLKYVAYATVFIMLAAVTAYFSFQTVRYGKQTTVPHVVGLNLTDATSLASSRGLRLKIEASRHNNEITAGNVLSQRITAGTSLDEGSAIGIEVSDGPASIVMPGFFGRTMEEARIVAVEKSVKITRTAHTHHNTVPSGRVIAQNPPSGAESGAAVQLLVSLGPYEN
ncbi:MAG: PASTA domain-containing protein [Nitrospirae bacterium]|nr:PASTA domain-containing protein [Nitrospirota bacterium]